MSAIFAALAFLRSPFGRIVGGIVLAAMLAGYIFHKGDSYGSARVQRKWDAAVQLAAATAVNARESSERDTPHLEPAPEPPVPTPSPSATCPAVNHPPRARNDRLLINDPFNRNRGRK